MSNIVPSPEIPYGSWKTMKFSVPREYWEDEFWNLWTRGLGVEADYLKRLVYFHSQTVLSRALNNTLQYDLEGILADAFARTASGPVLKLWEEMLGLPQDVAASVTVRRDRIITRMQQRSKSPTIEFIKSVVEGFGVTAEITDNPSTYSFVVKITSDVESDILTLISDAIEKVRPAHLAFTVEFTQTSWADLGDTDWATLGDEDWATF